MTKRKKKTRFRLIHLALIAVIIYGAFVFNNQRLMMNDLEEKRAETESEILKVESEIEVLEYEIDSSDSLEFVERVARDELGMVKPREIIYVDVNKPQNTLLDNLKGDN